MIVRPVRIRQAAAAVVVPTARPVHTPVRQQALVRLVAVINTLQRKPAVVRIVRADNMSIRLIPDAILIH